MSPHTDDETGAGAIVAHPIGHVRSARRDPMEHTHGKNGWDDRRCSIRLLPEHAGKLRGLEGYTHLIVLYWVHRAREWRMPRHHHKPAGVKVFATRMPVRPNPVGFCVAELLSFDPKTGEVVLRNLDACEGSPVLDLKPYIPFFDSLPGAGVPEWVTAGLEAQFGEAFRAPAVRSTPAPSYSPRVGRG